MKGNSNGPQCPHPNTTRRPPEGDDLENVNENSETYHTVSLAKVYEDRDGKLQDTTSFSAGELLRVAELAREAHGVIRDIRRDLAVDRRAEEGPAGRSSREERPARFRGRTQPGLER